ATDWPIESEMRVASTPAGVRRVAARIIDVGSGVNASLGRRMRQMWLSAVVTTSAMSVVLRGVPPSPIRPRPRLPVPPPSTADVPYSPTGSAVVDAMLQADGVSANDFVYALGSGDGRVVIMAAKKYGARGVGIEIDPALVKSSRQAAMENGVADRVSFVEGDMF